MSNPLDALKAAKAAKEKTAKPAAAKATKKADMLIRFNGLVIASQPIWEESTSQNENAKYMNDLALTDPAKYIETIKQMLEFATVEVREADNGSDESIEDALARMMAEKAA